MSNQNEVGDAESLASEQPLRTTTVEVQRHFLQPTRLMPNSPHPVLHYRNFLSRASERTAAHAHELFAGHGWQTQWIFRYGPTQKSHYHSAAHECMAVLSGSATIRLGAADMPDGDGHEDGAVEIDAHAGDIFVLPAGTAHKTFNTMPAGATQLLTPGDAHGVAADDVRGALANVQLSGFTMLGAYPEGSCWDWSGGGDHTDNYQKVWAVPRPAKDPVVGLSPEGICGLWD